MDLLSQLPIECTTLIALSLPSPRDVHSLMLASPLLFAMSQGFNSFSEYLNSRSLAHSLRIKRWDETEEEFDDEVELVEEAQRLKRWTWLQLYLENYVPR